jgi:hypothetical protein
MILQPLKIGRRNHMDSTSQSVDSLAPTPTPLGRGTHELPDLMDAIGRESGQGSESSQMSPLSIVPKPPTSLKVVEACGGRKMTAYLISVIATAVLAILGKASSEVLLALQTALGVLVGGNAAEHRFKGK